MNNGGRRQTDDDSNVPPCHDYRPLDTQLKFPTDSGEGESSEMEWLPVNDDPTPEPGQWEFGDIVRGKPS